MITTAGRLVLRRICRLSAICRDGPFPADVHRRENRMRVYANHPTEADLTHDGLLKLADEAHGVSAVAPVPAEDERLNREFADGLAADARLTAELYARLGGEHLRLADDLRRVVMTSHTVEELGLPVDMAGVARSVRGYWARVIGEPPGRE